MSLRYLFGPVTPRFAEQNLREPRRAGWCKTYGPPGSDVPTLAADTWPAVCDRLPAGWRPDALVLHLASAPPPEWVWSAQVPVVGLVTGWPLLWHALRRQLAFCDLVVAGPAAASRLVHTGIRNILEANLFGCERLYLEQPCPASPRDLDVLVVSNLPPAALREQAPVLGRVARIGQRRRVAIRCGVFGNEYRKLLFRSRIVLNHSVAGECTFRPFEAAAAGALLFQEAGNLELPAWLRPDQECVYYGPEDVEERLEHYLANEPRREQLVEAARSRVAGCCWETLWQEQVPRIESALSAAREQPHRPAPDSDERLLARCWRILGQPAAGDETLVRDLRETLAHRPESVALHLAKGLVLANTAPPSAAEALPSLQTALRLAPHSSVACLSAAEALVLAGERRVALEQARQGLDLLAGSAELSSDDLEWLPFPPAFDTLRVEWERAAWSNAGDRLAEGRAKQALLRWRLHALVAELAGELPAAYEAVLARPDLPSSWSLLGASLVRAGQPLQAERHLLQALELNPFDAAAARTLASVGGGTSLAEERRALARVAPQLLPPEPWLTQPQPDTAVTIVAGKRRRRKRLSLTIITLNEERNLPDCLTSVAGLADEIIVADTGSTDRTREIASRLGARVVEAPWCEDFAAARNAALEQATGDWVWWLDADDRLDAANHRHAAELFDQLGDEPDAYAMKVRSRLNARGTAVRLLDQVRLFPRHPDVRWRYRVHEQIMPAVNRRGGHLRWSSVVIDHHGYQDRKARQGKLQRNWQLLRLENAEHPDDPYTLFNLGWTAFDLGQAEEALGYLRHSLQRVRPTASYVRKLHVLLAQAHARLRQGSEALAVCDEALARFPDDRELLFERAVLLHQAGDAAAAEASLRELQAVHPGQYLASVDAGLCGYRALHLLGDLCRAQGRLAEAEKHWRSAVDERPDHAPLWACLGELWLNAQRWSDVEEAARRLAECDQGTSQSVLLRARGCLARGEAGTARQLVEEGLAAAPTARSLRQFLEQFQSGGRGTT